MRKRDAVVREKVIAVEKAKVSLVLKLAAHPHCKQCKVDIGCVSWHAWIVQIYMWLLQNDQIRR